MSKPFVQLDPAELAAAMEWIAIHQSILKLQDLPMTPPTGPPFLPYPSLSRRERDRLLDLDADLVAAEEKIVTESDVATYIFTRMQMMLLVTTLTSSYPGPPPAADAPVGARRSFVAHANVGLYATLDQPPLAPDVLVAVDVEDPAGFWKKSDMSYFAWRFGKVPDIVVEIVEDELAAELACKAQHYVMMGIPFYVLFDPYQCLGPDVLVCCRLHEGRYVPVEPSALAPLGLGLCLWSGVYHKIEQRWLRWTDAEGRILPIGSERADELRVEAAERQAQQERQAKEQERQRAEAERQRAEAERQRAEAERQRAEQLAAKLRALGIEP